MPFLPPAFKPREFIPIAAAIATLPFAFPDLGKNVRRYSLEGSAAVSSNIAYLNYKALDTITEINDLHSRYGDMGLTAEALAWVQDLKGVRMDRLVAMRVHQARFDDRWFLRRWPEEHQKELKRDLDRATNFKAEINNMREAMIALSKLQAGPRTP